MLFYFKLQYDIIQEHYRNNPQRTFTQRHFANYIRYDGKVEGNEHLFKPQALKQRQEQDPNGEGDQQQHQQQFQDQETVVPLTQEE